MPAPNVGRLERVTCNYTSNGGSGAPNAGAQVLKILTSGYTDNAAATSQAQVNRDAQASSGVRSEQVPLGAAQATYYADPDGPVLTVVYGRVTASFSRRPADPDRPGTSRPGRPGPPGPAGPGADGVVTRTGRAGGHRFNETRLTLTSS